MELPEVSKLLSSNKVKLLILDSPGLNFYPDTYELSIADATTRAILNRLVKDGDSKIWVVGTDGSKKDRLVLSF